ncbi:MAG: PAS domain-containing sensor histidine kinase [Microscillaceae bacterium]|nr:PAS domain-containing sensor histidine kinase [Microscillaceae bacterium]
MLAGQSYREIDTLPESNTFLETHYNLVKNREGQLLGASQIIRDISDRLQTEALWQASERRFAKIFNEALVGFALVESHSLQIVQANPALGRLLGYALPDLQEKKLADLIAPSDWPMTLRQTEDLRLLQSHAFSLDQKMNHREGALRWATVSGTHLFQEEGQSGYLLLMFDDITEQKKAEALLRESEAQKSALIEAFPDTIFHIDREGRVVQLNDKNRLLPYRRQEIIGKSIDDFPVPRKVKLRVKQLLLEAKLKREEGFYEIEVPTPVYTYILETRFVQSTENRVLVIVRDITQRKKEEGRMKELLLEAQRLNRDLEQQYAKIARKEEELARTNQQLRAKNEMLQKMTDELRHSRQELQETLQTLEERNFELDQFVYKTSHDLRSPLSSILGIINLMKIEPDQNRLPDYVERIEGRIVRLDDFIASMLHYSRNNRSEVYPEAIDFSEILQECIEDLKYYKNFDRIDIQTWLSGDEADFYNDGLRVKIIFTNIISNAIKYQDFQKSTRFYPHRSQYRKKSGPAGL